MLVHEQKRRTRLRRLAVLLVFALAMFGCRNQKPSQVAIKPAPAKLQSHLLPHNPSLDLASTDSTDYLNADFRILFIGNSHTASLNMPKTVQKMLNKRQSKQKVFCESRIDRFLSDHLARKTTVELIEQGEWDVIVLQGQKYSTSGKYSYPIDAALELTKLANKHGAKVIMFPEWGQKENIDEAKRVHALHESIVKKSGASIAPIGLVWDAAIEQFPDWDFHAPDGNHCNALGAFLTALVFDQILSNQFPDLNKADKNREFSADTQYGINLDAQTALSKFAKLTLEGLKAQ